MTPNSKSREYNSWKMMRARCGRKTHQSYKDYGGRGISVCERWASFQAFYEDMGPRPDGCSLDRIDNQKGYFKANCRWATRKQQQRNCRDNRIIYALGQRRCLSEWAELMSTSKETIRGRLRLGWMPGEAVVGVRYAL